MFNLQKGKHRIGKRTSGHLLYIVERILFRQFRKKINRQFNVLLDSNGKIINNQI